MRLFRHQQRQVRWVVLRGGCFVGPGTRQERQIEQLRRGEKVIAGDGANWISPVHVEDAAAAYMMALERAPTGSTFNVCDEPIRYREYMEHLAELMGAPRPRLDLSKSRPPSFRCSNKKAREVLGWKPMRSVWPEVGKDVVTGEYLFGGGPLR